MRKVLATTITAAVAVLALSACAGSSSGTNRVGAAMPNGTQASMAVFRFWSRRSTADDQAEASVSHHLRHDGESGLRRCGRTRESRYGLETLSFGTTHPSLPNYLSLIAGSYFGIQEDNPSCFAQPAQKPCDTASGKSLVDPLEANHMTWIDYQQSMPSVGYLGPQYPPATTSGNGPTHYAQKHNPFLYFKNIAKNATRLKNIVPLNAMSDLAKTLANPSTAPNFTFIAPDQCHDMHGTTDCPSGDALLIEGDKYANELVDTIVRSKTFKSNAALVIAWDEDDYSWQLGCCGSLYPHGGGHIPVMVITPNYRKPMQSSMPSNHYSELRFIEDAFGLSHLGQSSVASADAHVATALGTSRRRRPLVNGAPPRNARL